MKKRLTAEQLMLVVLVLVSTVFIVEPILADYPDDARIFPQLTGSVVFVGSVLLLLENYLPRPIQRFVGESISITSASDTEDIVEDVGRETGEEIGGYERNTLGAKYGYEVNETLFMVFTAILYLLAGWSAGFLFVTPLYVLGYTLWFRVNPIVSILLAALATVVIYLFMTYLVLPFDQGHIFDFSPFLPFLFDGLHASLVGGGA